MVTAWSLLTAFRHGEQWFFILHSVQQDNITLMCGTALRTFSENARGQYLVYLLFHKGDTDYCSAGAITPLSALGC